MNMWVIELICVAIIAVYWGYKLASGKDRRGFVMTMLLLQASSWLAEDTAIELYRFYQYSPDFHLFIHHVPLLIVCIWPVVIHSAWDLAKCFRREPGAVALITAGFILTDAALIEPVSVHVGLWSWNEPGFFGVPPIGVLGWVYFTWGAALVMDRHKYAMLLVAPLVAHALLLATWWGALRWVNHNIASSYAITAAYVVAGGTALFYLLRRDWRKVKGPTLLARLPGALFFFVMVLLQGTTDLIVFVLAFALPYLCLLPSLRPSK